MISKHSLFNSMANYTLSPEQLRIVEHLAAHPRACIFAPCGVGKTAATLQALANRQLRQVVVVAPLVPSVIDWGAEARMRDYGRPFVVHSVRQLLKAKDPLELKRLLEDTAFQDITQLFCVNYEQLSQLSTYLTTHRLGKAFEAVVLDELSFVKNHKGKRVSSAMKAFIQHTPIRWGLTGTPTPNSVLDLFNQVRVIDDGRRLGHSITSFRRLYAFQPNPRLWAVYKPMQDAPLRISKAIQDITLDLQDTRPKGIPRTAESTEYVPLPSETLQLYEQLQSQGIGSLTEGGTVSVSAAIALSSKLQQLTAGFVYDDDGGATPLHNLKHQAVAEWLQRHPDTKALIACQFVEEMESLLRYLQSRGIPAMQFPKKLEEKQGVIDVWNGKQNPYSLILHPASCGHGANLQQGGHTILWHSLPWSYERYHQLNARLARRGQQADSVEAVAFVAKGTVDEVVASAVKNKKSQSDFFSSLLRFWEQKT